MSQIQRIISGLLALCIVLGMLPMQASAENGDVVASGTCGDNLTWTLSKDGVLTISGTGEMWDILSYEGTWRDYMEQIKRVVVEEGVQSIGENAFYNCGNMTDISLPEGLRAIGTSAFQACNALTSVNLPNTLETIGFGAFNQCSDLQTIYIPASVSNISIYAFGSCFELTGFEVDSNNQYYCNDESGVLYTKDMRKLVQASPKLSGSYEVPAGVETIAFGSFNMCVGIQSITLPESVNRIEDDAFIMWTDSQSIYFTGNAPTFGYNCFGTARASVYYPANNETWTESVMQNYDGSITWVPYGDEGGGEEITITVNTTAGSVSAPEGGWKEGANTFTVTAEKPCVVAVSYDGGVTYTRLTASVTGVDNTYSFAANDMTESSIVAVIMTGDANGDGSITNADVTRLKAAYQNKVQLDSLKWLAADVNNSGDITNADVTRLKAVYQNKTELSW